MSGLGIFILHHDTITIEEYHRYRRTPRKLSLDDGRVKLDSRSLDERREARWSNVDYTGKESEL